MSMGTLTPWQAAAEMISIVEWGDRLDGAPHDDPNDPGGATRWGISQAAHPGIDVMRLSRQQAMDIYRNEYWLPLLPYESALAAPNACLNPALAIVAFDAAVNEGKREAVIQLQRALKGVAIDGIMGKQTTTASWYSNPNVPTWLRDRVHEYLVVRTHAYASMRGAQFYLEGWCSRLFWVGMYAGKFC